MREEFFMLRKLVAEDKIEKALEIFSTYSELEKPVREEVTSLKGKLHNVTRKEDLGLIDSMDAILLRSEISSSLSGLIRQIDDGSKSDPPKASVCKNSIFISYSHSDAGVVNIIKEKLKSNGISVIIDSESMRAGDDIRDFIHASVLNSAVTLAVISKKSLLSAWISMESMYTFYNENLQNSRKFIACYLEDDFFSREFTDLALDIIEDQLNEIRSLIKTRLDQDRNIRDLQNDLSRVTDLRNNLDEIIRRLREGLCINIMNENLDKNFYKVVEAIHS